jgi:multimeric flavodoxin WrbA
MKVLAISASPRKGGNSDVLCDQFLKGAGEAGHETEKISLSDKRLNPCTGCYGCGKTNACVIQDDMAEILQKLTQADVIVLATPVYFYSMDAQMKMMIDRCLPGAKEKEIIYGTGTWDKGDVYRHPAFEKAYESGKNL